MRTAGWTFARRAPRCLTETRGGVQSSSDTLWGRAMITSPRAAERTPSSPVARSVRRPAETCPGFS
jgi:hypothetical protein